MDQGRRDGYHSGRLILNYWDARIASSLNKIIQNSYFKKKVSLEEQKA